MRKVKAFYTLLWFDGGLVLLYMLAQLYLDKEVSDNVITACIAAAGSAAGLFMIGNGMEHMGKKDKNNGTQP